MTSRKHLSPLCLFKIICPLPEEDLEDHSTIARFEHEWKIVVDFGMFMFGLANADVEFSRTGTATWLVVTSLLVGKTLGIFFLGSLAEQLGFPLPFNVGKKELLVIGVIGGFGFTVALFVAGEAFIDPVLQGAAKMGAMLSCLSALVAVFMGRALRIRKIQ